MGSGKGSGEGQGGGSGKVDDGNVVAGSGLAICIIVIFFCCGLPTIFSGIGIIIAFQNSWAPGVAVGSVLIAVSILCLGGGVVAVILTCTNCCGKNNSNRVDGNVVQYSHRTTVVTQQQQSGYEHQPAHVQAPPPYSVAHGAPPPYQPSGNQNMYPNLQPQPQGLDPAYPPAAGSSQQQQQQQSTVIKY